MTIVGPELVAFDFDETIIDCNSDTFINQLAPDGRIPQDIVDKLNDSKDWIHYMKQVMTFLHKKGVTEEDLRKCLRRMPLIGGVKDLLMNMKNCGPNKYEMIIISDANTVFIGEGLENHRIDKAFRKVFTNPAKFDGEGCLQIVEYHNQDWCKLSGRNLCKGHVLNEYITKRKSEDGIIFSRVSYVGDGNNDVCPALKLGPNDLAFARTGFPMAKRLAQSKELKAQLHLWANGADIWKVLSKTQ